ncbi:NAD-dependent epimerase/dehydratase family protein [Haoranjiania flava]
MYSYLKDFEMDKKNILLTGGGGTVGFEVLKQLTGLSDKYTTTVFDVFSKVNRKKFASLNNNFSIVYGDITQKEAVRKVCRNVDVVIHLAAIIPPLADEKPELAYKVNVEGTKNLLDSLQELSPDAFFMYSSSISVYGDRLTEPAIKVGDALQPSEADYYAETKIACEELIKQTRLDWTIFRLAAIMGNHKISKLMFHMPLATSLEIATPADAARAFVNGIEQRPVLNKRIFNLGGGEKNRTTFRKFLDRSFDVFGLGKADFPEKTFAEKNFHCGYYADGADLENIVHFRQDTLDTYFEDVKKNVNPFVRILTKPFAGFIKKQLVKKSEPLAAMRNKDGKLISRFFH